MRACARTQKYEDSGKEDKCDTAVNGYDRSTQLRKEAFLPNTQPQPNQRILIFAHFLHFDVIMSSYNLLCYL